MKPIRTLSEEDLIRVFNGRNFRKLLKEASVHTHNSGYETEFRVSRDLQGRLHYSSLGIGYTDRVEISQAQTIEEANETGYTILNFHYHPDKEGPIIPSGPEKDGHIIGDLVGLNGLKRMKRIRCNPIQGIGQIGYDNIGELLLLQERGYEPLSFESLQEVSLSLDEIADKVESTEDVIRFFQDTRLYRATALRFRLSRNGIRIPKEEIQKIGIFAYTPYLVD